VENLERKDPAVNRVRVGQVLETATRLFTERGYEAASIRDLAAELAIRPSSLYHHFPGKQDILFTICLRMQRDFNAEVMPTLWSSGTPEEAIRSTIRQHILFSQRRKGEVLVNIRERRSLPPLLRARVNALRRAYRDAVADVIEEGRRQGLFHLTQARLAAMAILDMANGQALWFRPRDRKDLERLANGYAQAAVVLLRGWIAQ
jgi:AcrR family transcriptional regulator